MECKLLHRQAHCVVHDFDYDVDMEVDVSIQAQDEELTEVDDTTLDHLKASSSLEKLQYNCFKSSNCSKQATSNRDDTVNAILTNWLDLEIDYNKFLHEYAPAFSTSE